MSVRLLGRAFYADLPAHLKLTLLALCDEASEDGSGICIGQKRLAVKVGASERTVRSNLALLTTTGWLHKLEGKSAKYHTDQYEIEVERLPHGPETSAGRRAATSSGGEPDRPEVQRSDDRKLSVVTTGSPLPPTQELPVSTQEPSHRPKRDAMFRSFVTACGLDPETMTPREKRKAALALNDIVASGFVPLDDGYAEFVIRVRNYKLRWPNITVTPMGMSSQWSVCAGSPGAVDAETIAYHVAQEPDKDELAAFAAAAQANSWTGQR